MLTFTAVTLVLVMTAVTITFRPTLASDDRVPLQPETPPATKTCKEKQCGWTGPTRGESCPRCSSPL
jgi:hypothetical protein